MQLIRELIDAIESRTLLPGNNYKLLSYPSGVALALDPAAPGSASIKRYRVKTIGTEALTCHALTGTVEATVDVTIAKPFALRIFSGVRTIDSTAITYSASSTQVRVATSASATESQYVTPRYLADDEIYAATPIGGTGVTNTTMVDLNLDARAWVASC